MRDKIKDKIRNLLGEKNYKCLSKWRYIPINIFCSFFPVNNAIIFESNPDLACNSYAVYEYMLQKGLNHSYKLIWMVRDVNKYDEYKVENVFFIPKYPKTIREKWIKYFTCNRAKVSISCNLPIHKNKVSKKQINIYLDHGAPLKDITHGGRKLGIDCGYYIGQAKFFNEFLLKQYDISEKEIRILGVPRNDQLYIETNNLCNVYSDIGRFSKIVLWVPTFRSTVNKTRIDSDFDFPIGLPIVYTLKELNELNCFLAELDMLLIIKPHPAQDLSVIVDVDLSNLRILSNSKMLDAGIQTNDLLSQSDAMITDYSGIYYDYLLLDRPIGITLDDFSEYKSKTGFVFSEPLEILVGDHILSFDDLINFLKSVKEGKDSYLQARNKIKKLTNDFDDGKSSERVCDFVISKLSNK